MSEPRPWARFELPLHTVVEANRARTGSKSVAIARTTKLRSDATMIARGGRPRPPAGGLVVTLTRHTSGDPDDDGVVSALKAVRDGIADWLGRSDGDPSLAWLYGAGPARPGRMFVVVQVHLADPHPPRVAAAMLALERAMVGESWGWEEAAARYAAWVTSRATG